MPGPSFQNDRKLSVMTEPGPARSEEDLPPRRGGSLDWPARRSDWTSIPEHQEDNEETRLLVREDEENSDDEAPRTATATVPPVLPAFSIRARSTFEDRQWDWPGAGHSSPGWSQAGPPPGMPVPMPMPFEQQKEKPKPMQSPQMDLDAWRAVYDDLRARDESMIKDYREEIDTLLVFAGLFSAVVTAFVIESYTALQEDYTQTSADLLRTISMQLANSSSPAANPRDNFVVQASDVLVNTFWFLSLILSLVTALLGILLKQWIRTYIKWIEVTPESDAVALRHYRHTYFQSWHMPLMLTMLPVLLQVALVLFLAGMVLFLLPVNNTVATVTSIVVALCLLLGFVVTFLPLVQKTCPYKSPLTEFLISVLGYTLHTIDYWRSKDNAGHRRRGPRSYRGRIEDLRKETWSDIDLKAMRFAEAAPGQLYPSRALAHVGSLMTTLASTRSLQLWEKTISCLVDHYDRHTYNGTIDPCWALVTHIFGATPLVQTYANKSRTNLLQQFSVQGRVNLFHLCESSVSSLNGQREPNDRTFLKLLLFTTRALAYIEPGYAYSARFMPLVQSVSRWGYLMSPEELTSAVNSIHVALGAVRKELGWQEHGEDAEKICAIATAFASRHRHSMNDEHIHFLDLLLQLALDSAFSQPSGGVTEKLRKLLEFVGKGEYAKPRSLPRVRFIETTFRWVVELIRKEPKLVPQPWIQTLWAARYQMGGDIEEVAPEILIEQVIDREEFLTEELWAQADRLTYFPDATYEIRDTRDMGFGSWSRSNIWL